MLFSRKTWITAPFCQPWRIQRQSSPMLRWYKLTTTVLPDLNCNLDNLGSLDKLFSEIWEYDLNFRRTSTFNAAPVEATDLSHKPSWLTQGHMRCLTCISCADVVLRDEQMSKGWLFSSIFPTKRSKHMNWVGAEHRPDSFKGNPHPHVATTILHLTIYFLMFLCLFMDLLRTDQLDQMKKMWLHSPYRHADLPETWNNDSKTPSKLKDCPVWTAAGILKSSSPRVSKAIQCWWPRPSTRSRGLGPGMKSCEISPAEVDLPVHVHLDHDDQKLCVLRFVVKISW